MKKPLLYILFACTMLISCRKNELPKPEEDGTPVFYFRCNVNGAPVTISAGVNNYVMNSSHYQDQNNLYIYKGELKQSSCANNCGFALSVLINDSKLSALNAAMSTDSALITGNHGFNGGGVNTVLYSASFTPTVPDAAGNQYTWTCNSSSGNAIQYSWCVTNKVFNPSERVSVNLDFVDPTGCGGTLTKYFIIGNPLQTNIYEKDYDPVSGARKYSVKPLGIGSYSYIWDFGDGTPLSADAEPTHTFSTAKDSYTTTLTLIDLNKKDTCTSKYQIRSNHYDCTANYDGFIAPFLNPKLASAITILFTDQNGVTYSSADLSQPVSSKFEIISVENYQNNDKNEPTKKIKINFTCSFTGASGPVNISNGEAVIAVSYK